MLCACTVGDIACVRVPRMASNTTGNRKRVRDDCSLRLFTQLQRDCDADTHLLVGTRDDDDEFTADDDFDVDGDDDDTALSGQMTSL
jgi:hypothetical protein